MDAAYGHSLDTHEIAGLLAEARARTLLLVAPLTDEELRTQHSDLMSPIVWDLGHVAHFEEVWLLERLDTGGEGGGEGLRGIYDPFRHPRARRDALSLPSGSEAKEYLGRVRSEVLRKLRCVDPSVAPELLERGFVFRMVLQHEYQHNETILQTLQLKKGRPYPAPRGWGWADDASSPSDSGTPTPPDGMVRVPGGEVWIGTDDRSAAYDNERPRHRRTLAPFRIDATPVTNGHYRRFVEDGGYGRRELWTEEGWSWLQEVGAEAPMYWTRTDDGWTERTMDRTRSLDERRPVCHVCYHEAAAYARWAGKRLPTEFEWEAAAAWDPQTGAARRFPWGDEPATAEIANVDQLRFDTVPVGTMSDNVSPLGCYGMIGDVWEWTASDFRGYPGFEAFPYREYSEAFFGHEYKVLRGGSWATRPGAIRTTFRNWDFPIRRQIFAGFRCARDA